MPETSAPTPTTTLSPLLIRNAIRAFIKRQNQVLLLKKQDDTHGEYYALPGGGQEAGEDMKQTLKRECLEEIASDVEVDDLLFVADYFKQRSSVPDTHRHVVEFIFSCRVPDHYEPTMGHHPDQHQVAVVWVPQSNIANITLLPQALSACLSPNRQHYTYLGLVE